MKKILGIMVFLFIVGNINAFVLKKPVLAIGSNEELESKAYYKLYEIFKIKDVLLHNNEIYILENNDCCVYRFDMKGNFKGKFAGMGAGPKELYWPQRMEFVGDDLWVMDTRNARIQIYKSDGTHKKTLTYAELVMPSEIAIVDNSIFISSGKLYPRKRNLFIMNKQGEIKKRVNISYKLISKYMSLWHGAHIIALNNKQILLGYKYLPIVGLVDKNGKTTRFADMSDFYFKYREKETKFNRPPLGFSTTAFSKGPNNTVLIVTCDKVKRMCNTIMQFNSDLSKQLGEVKADFHVWGIRYFPKYKMIALISEGVYFYEVK